MLIASAVGDSKSNTAREMWKLLEPIGEKEAVE